MKEIRQLAFIFLIAIGLVGYFAEPPDAPTPEKQRTTQPSQVRVERGGITLSATGQQYSAGQVQDLLNRSRGQDGVLFYSINNIEAFTASAQATNYHHYIVNSFLVGYQPFQTDNLWMPMLTLARQKTYQLDHLTYRGYKEVWQTSKQAFEYTRGDCEDHALALADWLIEMGEDARVVLGTYKGQGHAWVVLFKDNKEYLLEATRKRGWKRMRYLPLARYEYDYRPAYMFNRSYFWKNNDPLNKNRYDTPHWQEQSRYGSRLVRTST